MFNGKLDEILSTDTNCILLESLTHYSRNSFIFADVKLEEYYMFAWELLISLLAYGEGKEVDFICEIIIFPFVPIYVPSCPLRCCVG